MGQALILLLRPLGRRLHLRDVLFLATRTLWLTFLGAALAQLTGRLIPLEHCLLWSLIPLVVWTVIVLGYLLFRRQPLVRVARRCDAELGLRERLATALMLEERNALLHPCIVASFHPSLATLQRQDALATAQTIDPRRDIPLRLARRPLALAAVLLLAAALLAFLPNPMDDVLAERATVRETLAEQAEQVEALREEIQAQEGLDPEEREELLRQLEELAEKLRANRGDPEEALADLSAVEEALRRQLDPQSSAREAALEQLAANLASLSGDQRPRDAGEMAEILRELAGQLGELEAGEREALAQALEQMASQSAPTDSALALALASLAGAVRQGDSATAAQAAQAASNALSRAASDLAAQRALNRALAQLQRGSQQVAGRQGDRETRRQGEGQGGQGGTSARTLPPGHWPGRVGEPDRPNRPEAVGELEQVYSPWGRPGGEGEQEFIPGREGADGETTTHTESDPSPGAESTALVPYSEVYAAYQEAASQTMEREYVPTGLKDYVREYFSRLEP